ncbi:MAG TPA: protein kinase [Thermoanaerobaculia bacterium]|jgi:serine/threonine protein kinase/tetratricopeptide (TPR) repeat protein
MISARESLGQYEILGQLGAGGMGEVYIAHDPVLGRKVAIKVLPVRLTGDAETLARFTHEARSASSLNHPNIVTIHDIDTANGRPYIVMEYIDGRDLRSYVNEGPLTARKTLDVAAQVAEGLAAAHEHGIVHRDLKPENVMVTKDGFVKILDFGLAKMTRPASEDAVTAELNLPGTTPGTILGTVGYMSPEQAQGKLLDPRSDQFALGAILYELATGKPAFDAPNAIDTLSAILHEDPPPIQGINAKAPEQFCWIVERLLAKNPNDRYASTRDAAHELRALSNQIAANTSADSLWSIRQLPRPRPRRRKLILVASSIAVVVLATLGYTMRHFLPGADAQDKKYVAVMHFKDLTGDPNGQFVVDGMAETLVSRLAHFPSVQVMRPPTEALNAADIRKVARDLGATVALTGSMQRNRDQFRVNFRVLDVQSGAEKGDLIDGPIEDLFAIEDRLAMSVASTLQLGAPMFHPTPADNTISHRRFLEALGHLRRYDSEPEVDAGIQILQELGAKSNSASVQAALGRAYLYKFRITHDPKWAVPATAACERAVAADPQNPDVHLTLGDLRWQTGKYGDAISEYKATLAQEANNADAFLGLAETYKASGKAKDAEAAYSKSIDLQPNYWGGYNKLGAFYASQGRYADAARMFEKVVQLVPDNLVGYNNLGAVYTHMGRYEDAITVFSRSIRTKPTAQANISLGTCYYYLGRYSDAAAAYEKATVLAPHRYLPWANLADAYRWSPGSEQRAPDVYQKAISLLQDELRVNPSDQMLRGKLAECLAKQGKKEEARTEIDRALSSDPLNATLMYRAAIVANSRGESSAAIQWLKKAIEHGYSRSDIASEPEFALLRNTDEYKKGIQ